MNEAPDLLQPVVGFRVWHLEWHGETLQSAGLGGMVWPPGEIKAECRDAQIRHNAIQQVVVGFGGSPNSSSPPAARPEHDAPAAECGCGLYAFHAITDRLVGWSRQGAIVGAVAMWGAMEVHRTGIRAEFARIVAMALPDSAAVDSARRQHYERLAARYGVALVPLVSLEEEAARHGIRVPEEMLPEEDAEPPFDWGRNYHLVQQLTKAQVWPRHGGGHHVRTRPEPPKRTRHLLAIGLVFASAAVAAIALPTPPTWLALPRGIALGLVAFATAPRLWRFGRMLSCWGDEEVRRLPYFWRGRGRRCAHCGWRHAS